jgi:hypothetical protein
MVYHLRSSKSHPGALVEALVREQTQTLHVMIIRSPWGAMRDKGLFWRL